MKLITLALLAVSPPQEVPQSRTVDRILRSVDQERLETTLKKLVSFGTRHTFSDTKSEERGIGAARRWIKRELEGIAKEARGEMLVDFHSFTARSRRTRETTEAKNVFAILKGKTHPRQAIVFGGHYDSLNLRGGADDDAPGADDDASGTTAVIEAARILSRHTFDRTIIFVCFAGEEQGLLGSRAFARELKELEFDVVAMLNNDIIANVRDAEGRVESDSCRIFADAPSRQMMRHARLIGNRALPGFEIRLQRRADRRGRGGDQQSFQAEGIRAVRLMETAENQRAQHTQNDTIEKLSFPYMTKIFTIDAALLATLAGAAPAPTGVSAEAFEGGVKVSWKAVEGAKGYRVAIRHGRNLAFTKVVTAPKPGIRIPLDIEADVSVSVAAVRNDALGPFGAEVRP